MYSCGKSSTAWGPYHRAPDFGKLPSIAFKYVFEVFGTIAILEGVPILGSLDSDPTALSSHFVPLMFGNSHVGQ